MADYRLAEQRTEQGICTLRSPVEVEQSNPCGHQSVEHYVGYQLHELVSKLWVLLALVSKASSVEGDRTGGLNGACVE